MIIEERDIERLRQEVEAKVGRQMQTPKDFDFLVGQIFVKTQQRISVSTLKRVWGYVSSKGDTSETTLNLLSKFAGYENFTQFCQQEHEATTSPKPLFRRKVIGGLIALLAILVLLFVVFKPVGTSGRQVLKSGQTFASYEEFLSLFNIKATELLYFQRVPECSVAYVWAPQYHHPTYHNEGNPDSLMPTISEYLTLNPLNDSVESQKFLMEEQRKSYPTAILNNQVRLVFMKNLPGDTCFTFTGIYRVSYTLSDSTRVVWTRMSSECDLNDLEHLTRFRN